MLLFDALVHRVDRDGGEECARLETDGELTELDESVVAHPHRNAQVVHVGHHFGRERYGVLERGEIRAYVRVRRDASDRQPRRLGCIRHQVAVVASGLVLQRTSRRIELTHTSGLRCHPQIGGLPRIALPRCDVDATWLLLLGCGWCDGGVATSDVPLGPTQGGVVVEEVAFGARGGPAHVAEVTRDEGAGGRKAERQKGRKGETGRLGGVRGSGVQNCFSE